ncbi:hypothetical protein G6F65_023079 [Rhizopus arrhizus]|uniref:Uncharacterized protein n=1 Tax=Rhizopus delemar TaxID=936053 RepID=A0A9P6XNV8_9FUNG|nr:hypothetical protein G6F65_023079 [Rhizopus arrhizus]KAG1529339.1 hypothetical protein G6F50_018070 [Rhizopus delemar]
MPAGTAPRLPGALPAAAPALRRWWRPSCGRASACRTRRTRSGARSACRSGSCGQPPGGRRARAAGLRPCPHGPTAFAPPPIPSRSSP